MFPNKRISAIVFKKPNYSSAGVSYNTQDGNFYQNDKYFADHEDALFLLFFHDDLEVCNPLGCTVVDMFYYSTGNMCPKFRSKWCSIRFMAIANTSIVKKYGMNAILRPIINNLHLLYKGYRMEINSWERVICGKVLTCNRNTEISDKQGPLKESVFFGDERHKLKNKAS